jgi:hypothetical protein
MKVKKGKKKKHAGGLLLETAKTFSSISIVIPQDIIDDHRRATR